MPVPPRGGLVREAAESAAGPLPGLRRGLGRAGFATGRVSQADLDKAAYGLAPRHFFAGRDPRVNFGELMRMPVLTNLCPDPGGLPGDRGSFFGP